MAYDKRDIQAVCKSGGEDGEYHAVGRRAEGIAAGREMRGVQAQEQFERVVRGDGAVCARRQLVLRCRAGMKIKRGNI